MVEFLISLDRTLFSLVYTQFPHTSFLDFVFATLSGIGDFGAIWILIGSFFYIIGERPHRDKLFGLFLALGLSFFISELILKNFFARIRPDMTFSTYSFPSSHATIGFSGAYVASWHHRKFAMLYFLVAFLIGFSRIYLGRHYPSDVVFGAILGLIIGFLSVKITRILFRKGLYEAKRKSSSH